MLDRIAQDLGINKYEEELMLQYKCRIIYSAMACWIKAIALDRFAVNQEKDFTGVSRRHIYERSQTILKTLIKMFPEIGPWFDLSENNDNSIKLIITRLINHGDLLNAGFETNLALSAVHTDRISSGVEAVYGKIIDSNIKYSGVSSIRYNKVDNYLLSLENVKNWFQTFLKEALWSRDLPNSNLLEYFNSYSLVKNNYEAWQKSMYNIKGKVVITRISTNNNSYTYYLLKPKEKLVHKIDSFLQKQGFERRVMYALRSYANNKAEAKIVKYNNYIKVRLNALLPLKESVLLESYAWPVRKINDKLEWVMDYSVWEYIRPHIEALDIKITEESHG